MPSRPSLGVYIFSAVGFDRVCCHLDDLKTSNKCLTAKLLKHVIGIIGQESFFQRSIGNTVNWLQNSMSG